MPEILASRPAVVPAPDIRFVISDLNPSQLLGWAFNTGQPDQPVLVVLRVNGRVVAEQVARLPIHGDGVEREASQCGFSFDIAPCFSGGPDEPVEFAVDVVVGKLRGTALRRRVSRDGALLHHYFGAHLPLHGAQSARLRRGLEDVGVALCQPRLEVGFPAHFAAPADGVVERAAHLNRYLAHLARCEQRRPEFLLDDDALFDFLFTAFENSVYRGRVNLVPVDGGLAAHCAEVVRRVGGHRPVPRILHHFIRRFGAAAPDAASPDAATPDIAIPDIDEEAAYDAQVHAFIRKALIGWRLPARLLGEELLSLFRRPAGGLVPEMDGLPYAVRLAARHDDTLQGLFDPALACDRLGLILATLFRLAAAGLHRDLLPAGTIESLTRPVAIMDGVDSVVGALCRRVGMPDPGAALGGEGGMPAAVCRAHATARPRAFPAGASGPPRLRVIGNLAENGGLRQNLEHSLAVLRRAGFVTERVDARTLSGALHLDNDGPVINLFHVAPVMMPRLMALEWPELVSRAYNIGYFMWETEDLPPSFDLGLSCIDEVWTGSAFCAAAFARRFAGPVVNMLHAVAPRPSELRLPRARFGLPESGVCFYFAFDAMALFGRKNPLLTAFAFQRAFTAGEDVTLVIKIRNIWAAAGDSRNQPYWNALRAMAARDPRIRIIAQEFSEAEMQALLEATDCYVSLHRAEGFGYTMAEAMLAGKPVIASRYSGNLDFMNDGNALLVGGTMSFIRCEDGFGEAGGRWFDADPDEAARLMRRVFADPESVRGLAAAGQDHVRRVLSHAALEERYVRRIRDILLEVPAL